jgi:hypothetical protein
LTTLIFAVPGAVTRFAGTVACSWATLLKVVVNVVPFQCTTEFGKKPLPLIMSVKAALPSGSVAGLREVATGAGLLMATDRLAEVFEVKPPSPE